MSTPEDKEPKYTTQNQYEAWKYVLEKLEDFEKRLKVLEAKE